MAPYTFAGAPPPLLVVLMEGCSGSTFVIGHSKSVAECLGYKAYPSKYELFKEDKNRWYKQAEADGGGWTEALNAMAQDASRGNATIVINADFWSGSDISPLLTDSMHDLDTPFVVAYRRNVLDLAICNVRDCFHPGKTLGYPTYDGEQSDLCFNRRFADIDQAKYKAHLDVDKLVPFMLEKEAESQAAAPRLERYGYTGGGAGGRIQVVDYESLASLQYPDVRESGQYTTSVDAWERLLRTWRLPFTREKLEACLEPYVGTYHPPRPHATVVDNIEEVAHALKTSTWDGHLAQYLRV